MSPEGHFSRKKSSFASPCPVGTYQSQKRSGSCVDCSATSYCDEPALVGPKTCPTGFFCPPKSIKPRPCPAGKFNPAPSKQQEGECKDCDPGMYCETPGLNATSGPCDAGFFCTRGSPYRNPVSFPIFSISILVCYYWKL